MIPAYERGRAAAQHGKHVQACPFDTGTNEWRSWRDGFHDALSSSNDPARQLALRRPMPKLLAPPGRRLSGSDGVARMGFPPMIIVASIVGGLLFGTRQ
jgi:ribosome modulation factor